MINKIIFVIFFFSLFLNSEIDAQAKLENSLTISNKIYMLSEIWKEVSYNFCDPQKLKEIKWDSLYRSNINEVINTKSDYAYYLLLKKFIASIGDGHTKLEIENVVEKLSLGELPIGIQNVGPKYYLIAFLTDYVKNIPMYSEVERINDLLVQEYMDKYLLPYAHASTPQRKIKYALGSVFGVGLIGDSIKIQFKKQDGNREVRWLKYISQEKVRIAPRSIAPSFLYKGRFQIEDSILYLGTNSFGNNSVLKYIIKNKDLIAKTKGIIIDLRYNEGGDEPIADSLLMCFLNCTSLKTYKSLCRKNNAFYTAMGYGYPNFKPYYNNEVLDTLPEDILKKGNLPTFSQPLVVLIGSNTCSAAEDFLLALKINAPHRAVLIGTPTSGSTGAPLVRVFDSGVYYKICTRKPLVDPVLFKNGIQPDILYEKTIDEYLTNSDHILKIASDFINRK
jgi:hypothetical protein